MAQHASGFITASTVGPFLTGKGSDLLKGGITAAKRIAMERSGKVHISNSGFEGNKYTEWGNEHEADAIQRYEEIRFVTVHGKQVGIADGWLSCTPDGYIGADGLIETKCPFMEHIHMDYLLEPDTLKAEYYDQVQFQLMLSNRKWCDLVSYHPHFDDPLDIVYVRIKPDEEWQEKARDRFEQVEKIINGIMGKL